MFGLVFKFFKNVLELNQFLSLIIDFVLHLFEMLVNISRSICFLTFLSEEPELKSGG